MHGLRHSVLGAARLREFFRAIGDSGLDVLNRDIFPRRFAPNRVLAHSTREHQAEGAGRIAAGAG